MKSQMEIRMSCTDGMSAKDIRMSCTDGMSGQELSGEWQEAGDSPKYNYLVSADALWRCRVGRGSRTDYAQ